MTSGISAGVVGCGRMGRLHARTYAQMPQTKLVGIYDAIPKAAEAVAGEFATKVVSNLDELAEQVSAGTIAGPTGHHLKAGEPFLKRGGSCFIEKTLARNLGGGKQIVELGRGQK